MFQAEGIADAKASRKETVHIFIQEMSRRPAELEQSEQRHEMRMVTES